jgi:hypothetical protein
MPANKNGRKSGASATPKKKSSAPQHAAQREQRQQGRATAPAARRSTKAISQSRYPGETPLTGEDRPAARAGGKRGRGSSRKR